MGVGALGALVEALEAEGHGGGGRMRLGEFVGLDEVRWKRRGGLGLSGVEGLEDKQLWVAAKGWRYVPSRG